MKAMILAAGHGKRMRPLTDITPKPLLTVGKHSLIEHNLLRLASAGVHDVVINLHYLSEQIRQKIGSGRQFGLNIQYSEELQLLGPGGGIVNALPLLGDSHFILMGADLWSDFPIETLLDKTTHLAHLVMVENPKFNLNGDYGIDSNGMLCKKSAKLTYAGYSVWHPSVFAGYPNNSMMEITPFIDRLIDQHQITAEKYSGSWYNIGTPHQLKKLNHMLDIREAEVKN